MTIDDIKALIAADESRTLELKKTTGELKDGMAEVLYRSMWLENWGSGAKRIIEVCQEQGVLEPTWRWDGAFVYVTFKRPTKVVSNTTKDSLGGDVALSTPQASKAEIPAD